MTPIDVECRDEILIFPAVKRAVSVLAKVTAWGFVAAAALWLSGLALLLGSWLLLSVTEPPVKAIVWVTYMGVSTLVCEVGSEFLSALLLPCLYLLALWCHQVLLAGRGTVVTRWLLLILLFFSFLHPVCRGYLLLRGHPLMEEQFLLADLLYTILPCIVAVNWFRMTALPLRYRLLLVFFLLALAGNGICEGSFIVLLLPCFSFWPLRLLARYAPLIVSLPPKEERE